MPVCSGGFLGAGEAHIHRVIVAILVRNDARGEMVPDWTAKSLALHIQAVIQGAFILAKAAGGAEIAADSIDHLRRYIENAGRRRN